MLMRAQVVDLYNSCRLGAWCQYVYGSFFLPVQVPHNSHIINTSSHKIMYISPVLLTDSNIFTTFARKISNHAKYLFVHNID